MGVWIETRCSLTSGYRSRVTPYMGVWIETNSHSARFFRHHVTPYMGVWIETSDQRRLPCSDASLPIWECGLKRLNERGSNSVAKVTPYVGVWIVTSTLLDYRCDIYCRYRQ